MAHSCDEIANFAELGNIEYTGYPPIEPFNMCISSFGNRSSGIVSLPLTKPHS